MTKAIFFDLDGTILDTVPDIQDSINRMLAENGLPPLFRRRDRAAMWETAPKSWWTAA